MYNNQAQLPAQFWKVIKTTTLLLFCLFIQSGIAQESDYDPIKVVEQMPRFSGCEDLPDEKAKKECATKKMLEFIYKNIEYPKTAIEAGTEGTVVIRFVVDKEGIVREEVILRDIGDGCAEEALRVVRSMREKNIVWIPGQQKGKPVAVYFNLPVKFRLDPPAQEQEFMIDGEVVKINPDKEVSFKGGPEAFQKFVDQNLVYPESGLAACKCGQIELQIIVKTDGSTKLLEVFDINNLGMDFEIAASSLISKSLGKWELAEHGGKAVAAPNVVKIPFVAKGDACKNQRDLYHKLTKSYDDAMALMAEDNLEDALKKLNEGLALAPDDTKLRYTRGFLYFRQEKIEKACEDFNHINFSKEKLKILGLPDCSK